MTKDELQGFLQSSEHIKGKKSYTDAQVQLLQSLPSNYLLQSSGYTQSQ